MKWRNQLSLFARLTCRSICNRGEGPGRRQGDLLAAAVVFNLPLETPYHYLVPDALRPLIQPGQRVEVPFARE